MKKKVKLTIKLTKGRWTSQDKKDLRRLYPKMDTHAVAEDLGRPFEAVKKKASRLGLRKSAKRMRQLGRA